MIAKDHSHKITALYTASAQKKKINNNSKIQ